MSELELECQELCEIKAENKAASRVVRKIEQQLRKINGEIRRAALRTEEKVEKVSVESAKVIYLRQLQSNPATPPFMSVICGILIKIALLKRRQKMEEIAIVDHVGKICDVLIPCQNKQGYWQFNCGTYNPCCPHAHP